MASIEDLLPNVALEDVFDFNAVEMTRKITDVLSIATIILSIFVTYLILAITPRYMREIKPYLLFYVLTGLTEKIIAALFKPFVIFPYSIYYPVGWLAPMSHTTVQILSATTYFMIFLLLTSLLMLLIDRYFAMTVTNSIITPFYKKKVFYLFVCLAVTAIVFAVNIYANLFMDQYNYGEVTTRFMLRKISGSQQLLDFQPDLLSFNLSVTAPQLLIEYTIIGFGSFFLVLFIVFIVLNVVAAKKVMHLVSVKSRKNHSMLIRMTYAQIVGVVGFIFLPHIAFLALSMNIKNTSYLFAVALTVQDFFLLYDLAVTVFYIKPYRVYIVNLPFKCIKTSYNLTGSNRVSSVLVMMNTVSPVR